MNACCMTPSSTRSQPSPAWAQGGTATAAPRAARESDLNEVIGRCRHDVALMEYVLGGSTDADQAAHERDPDGRILVAVEAVALRCAPAALTCTFGRRPRPEARKRPPGPGPHGPVPVPVPVVAAVARALREALSNVARHAGTSEAWVDMCRTEAGAGPQETGGLTVTVRDRGVGFDPGSVGPDRLGIGRSIVERIADCGGTASVRSSPGNGTTVTLCVPVRAEALSAQPATVARRAPVTMGADPTAHAGLAARLTRHAGAGRLMPRGMR